EALLPVVDLLEVVEHAGRALAAEERLAERLHADRLARIGVFDATVEEAAAVDVLAAAMLDQPREAEFEQLLVVLEARDLALAGLVDPLVLLERRPAHAAGPR